MHSRRSGPPGRPDSGQSSDEPELILLWRHPVDQAVQLLGRSRKSRAVLVRLVNQAQEEHDVRAACRGDGLRVVTLPLAFAGLHEDDRVLRDAVLRRLQEQRPAPGLHRFAAAALPA